MVLHGQYLERATVIDADGLALEGLYHRGGRRPPALLVPPPASAGSPMDLPVVAELAWAFHKAGHATLRYNPRGLGASQGTPDPATAAADARAARAVLAESNGAPVAVVAVGEGAATGLALARVGEAGALVLVAPPAPLDLAGLAIPVRVLLPAEAAWPAGGAPVERVEDLDAAFLRGLPLLGKAVTAFLAGL